MQKDKDHKSSNHSPSRTQQNWHGGDRSNSSAGRKSSRTSSNDRK